MSPAIPQASVIVAVNPHDNDLGALLAGYAAQTPVAGGFELVVVDNGARSDVASVCREYSHAGSWQRLHIESCARPGRAAANNAGVRAARADLLIFMADDFIPTRNLVRAHCDFHAGLTTPSVGIGPACFTEEARADPFRRWLEDSGNLFGVPLRNTAAGWQRGFFYAGNASLPRSLFERAGAFDEAFLHDALDDLEFGARLRALRIETHLLPKAKAWHDHRLSLEERMSIVRCAGEAAAQLEVRRPGAWPWAGLTARPVAELVAEAARPTDGRAPDNDQFRACLDLAFVEGYRGAQGAVSA